MPLCRRGLLPCLLAIVTMACGKSEPAPPNVMPAPTVTGVERLGWTQEAADGRELSTFRYALYLDGLRTELTGVSCQPSSSPAPANFECTVPLPAMPAGRHTLQLVTFVIDGDLRESFRSAPLLVNKTSAATAAATAPPNASRP